MRRGWLVALSMLGAAAGAAQAQQYTAVAPDAAQWRATDSVRVEDYLGRRSVYINRGVALLEGVTLRDGVIAFDMAATPQTSFLGVVFHASAPDQSEVLFFRPGQSGTEEAVQYAPALNGIAGAWQVFHGAGANARAELPRQRWIPVRIELTGGRARVFVNDSSAALLEVPRLAGVAGTSIGLWAGAFGRGAYFSNLRYAVREATPPGPPPAVPSGTLTAWQLSPNFDASAQSPEALPSSAVAWESVAPEPDGLVLINRHRRARVVFPPVDPATRMTLDDSIMGGRVAGVNLVYARTTIRSERDEVRRLQFGYSDGLVIHLNGQPLFFGMNVQFFRGDGIMSRVGDAVYLPLRRGDNELVFAVSEFSGGWAFWARLDASGAT